MEFCMNYVKRKNVNIMNLIEIEQRLRKELKIDFKFAHYYEDTLEITINKGDNTEAITINRWFQSIKQAYSEIATYIKSVYSTMMCYYENKHFDAIMFEEGCRVLAYDDNMIVFYNTNGNLATFNFNEEEEEEVCLI